MCNEIALLNQTKTRKISSKALALTLGLSLATSIAIADNERERERVTPLEKQHKANLAKIHILLPAPLHDNPKPPNNNLNDITNS